MPTQGDADFKLRQTQLESLTMPTNNKLQNAALNSVIFISSFICAAFSNALAPVCQNETSFAHAVPLTRSP